MTWLRVMFSRIEAPLRGRRDEQRLNEELSSHLELLIEENVRCGMAPEEARYAARRALGNITLVGEMHREQRGLPFLDVVARDVRYALRQLRRAPGFTTVAVLTLMLGIGANSAIFSLIDAVLLRSLPVAHPEQLFFVKTSRSTTEHSRISYPLFEQLRTGVAGAAELAAMSGVSGLYATLPHGVPEPVTGQLVTGDYFSVLGTRAALGRLITPADNLPSGARPVAVVSYRYFQQRLGGNPAVLGSTLRINTALVTIVGVAPPSFYGAAPGSAPDFWMPARLQPQLHYAAHYSNAGGDETKPWADQDQLAWVLMVARLRDTSLRPTVEAKLNVIFHRAFEQRAANLREHPLTRDFLAQRLELESGSRGMAALRRNFSGPLFLLMGTVALVLLIACANLANLLLARNAARQHELAVRLSIGAGRAQLVRQLLVESLVLATMGGVAAMLLVIVLYRGLAPWASREMLPLGATPAVAVFAFTAAVAVAAALLFGLAPAFSATRVDPIRALKSGMRDTTQSGASRWSVRKTLVASQVALSLVLLVGAGLWLRTLLHYLQLNPGFDEEHLLTVWMNPGAMGYDTKRDQLLAEQLVERIRALPGVRSAAAAGCGLAAAHCGDYSDIYIPGRPNNPGDETVTQVNYVGSGYLRTAGISLLQGRDFSRLDNEHAPKVAIVNQEFGRRFLGGQNALGRHFGYSRKQDHEFEIVGVVGNASVNNVLDPPEPMAYFPQSQAGVDLETLTIRSAGDPGRLINEVRRTISQIDPNLPVDAIQTLREAIAMDLQPVRLIAQLTTTFGLLALGLACLGVYGVLSYLVARQTPAIGIRLALGCPQLRVVLVIWREMSSVVAAGLVAGIVAALLLARLGRALMFGLNANEPLIYGGALAVLAVTSTIAALLPARRAAAINPMQALRIE